MKKLITVIISIFLISCLGSTNQLRPNEIANYTYTHRPYQSTPIREIPIWMDRNFSEMDKTSIDDAIMQWNYALNGYIKLKLVDTDFNMELEKIKMQEASNGWLFMEIYSNSNIIPESKSGSGYRTIAFCNKIGGNHMYIIRDRMLARDIFGVSMHEMGHLLGADHDGKNLMYPHYTQEGYQCVDHDAIKEVADYQKLPIDRLNYCVYN